MTGLNPRDSSLNTFNDPLHLPDYLMQHTKELTRDNVPHTKKIKFWSNGQMHTAAFERWFEFRSNKQQADANAIASEWIICRPNSSNSLNTNAPKTNYTNRSYENDKKQS